MYRIVSPALQLDLRSSRVESKKDTYVAGFSLPKLLPTNSLNPCIPAGVNSEGLVFLTTSSCFDRYSDKGVATSGLELEEFVSSNSFRRRPRSSNCFALTRIRNCMPV